MRKQTRAVAVLTVLALCALASAVWIQGGGSRRRRLRDAAVICPNPFLARWLESWS